MYEKLDVLNRKDFIYKLIQLVEGFADKKQGCCFGIDGAWGSGKTFVLEKFEEKLKEFQLEETAGDKYYVFHYDCWKYDYYGEPTIAIITAMLDEIDRELSLFSKDVENAGKVAVETVKTTLKKIASELCKNKIGIDLVEVASEILDKTDKEKVKDFDSLYGFKKALEETRKGMQEIANDKTVVIVVDELDRCLPTYSIKVLERLHHIFNGLDNVIVIVSMDKSQLEHSIKAIYGEIDVDTYLRKFISFKVHLNNGVTLGYAGKFEEYFSMFDMSIEEKNYITLFLSKILNGLDMRTQERIFNKAKVMHMIALTDDVRDCSIMTFEILYLTVSLKMKDKNLCWLSKIWTARFVKIEERLGEEYYGILNSYGQEVRSTTTVNNKILIRDTIIGKTFFWLATLYKDKDSEAGNIAYSRADNTVIRFIERFADLIDIIDAD